MFASKNTPLDHLVPVGVFPRKLVHAQKIFPGLGSKLREATQILKWEKRSPQPSASQEVGALPCRHV